MGRLVQLARKAKLDAAASHDRSHLADSLSRDSAYIWLCDRSSYPRQTELDDRLALYHQFGCQPHLHPDSVRNEKSPLGIDRHRDRLGNDPLEYGGHLVALEMVSIGANPLSRLGLNRQRFAMDYHHLELGKMIALRMC
jgi:hypothetical protein